MATLKNQSTGSVIPKNWMCIPCGELYREMTSNPSRKNPNALAKASWCFCRGWGLKRKLGIIQDLFLVFL